MRITWSFSLSKGMSIKGTDLSVTCWDGLVMCVATNFPEERIASVSNLCLEDGNDMFFRNFSMSYKTTRITTRKTKGYPGCINWNSIKRYISGENILINVKNFQVIASV